MMKTEINTDEKLGTFETKREFNADISLVWRAWTEAELLDQWWAPAPWKCETKVMDFREGGKWIYDMVGPEGERHGGIQLYETIVLHDYFSGKDAFADIEGNINQNLPVCEWRNTFIKTEKGTLVVSLAQYPDQKSLEMVIKMGMAEGLTLAHNQLEDVLRTMTK
ncbi:MAG TPA: SRPBCC domain-containing protein [Saprospiraceae bacterium]|nr:SRPBCC domain-containing protein [Saprospiraceae bacterium]